MNQDQEKVTIFIGSIKQWNNTSCEEFHQKVIQMMTCGMLQIENEEKDDDVGMIRFQEKKLEMCRLQHIKISPLKLVLTKPTPTMGTIMHCLIIIKNSPNIDNLAHLF